MNTYMLIDLGVINIDTCEFPKVSSFLLVRNKKKENKNINE